MLRLSGPVAVEFEELVIASLTVLGVKGAKLGESGCFLWSVRMILRERGLDLWLVMQVNCFVNALAIFCGEVKTLFLKEMGWFAGGELCLPERDLRRDQNLAGLVLWSALERRSCHFSLEWVSVREEISSLRIGILGSVGLDLRIESRSRIRALADLGKERDLFLMKPAGTKCFEEVWRILRKMASPWEQDEGEGRSLKRISVSRVKDSQSAFLKLWNVLNGQGGLVTSGREIRMGRWSDLRVVRVVQEKSIARWAEQRDRSGEVGCPLGGRRVGESSLRRHSPLPFRASASASPRIMADWSRVMEFQEGWCALKSPTIKELSGVLKRRSKSGEWVGEHEE